MILHKHGLHPYVDGMGVDVLRRFIQYPEYLRDSNALQAAFDNATVVKPETRARILKNALIVTTAGMLNGGPALFYLSKIHDDPGSKVLLTGYQVKGTNGYHALTHKRLTNRNRVLHLRMAVEQYDFSAHSGDKELKRSVQKFCDHGGEVLFTMHGDRTEEFAAWAGEYKVDAAAPANGDEFMIE